MFSLTETFGGKVKLMSSHFEFRHTKTLCENYLKLYSAKNQIQHPRQDEFHFRTDIEAMITVSSFLLKQEKGGKTKDSLRAVKE